MKSHKKRIKKTKITIHHRTKKKNSRFSTNNNDRRVTNMNSFFLFPFLFILYYIFIFKRIGIRLHCFLKCIDKYIQKMHEIGNACGTFQDCVLLHYHHGRSLSLSLSFSLLASTLHSITWMSIRVWRRQLQRKKENYTSSRIGMRKKVAVVRQRQWCLEHSHWKRKGIAS
jgi:hypothetical protein